MLEYDLYLNERTVMFRVVRLEYDPRTVRAILSDNGVQIFYGFDAEIWSNYIVLPEMYNTRPGYRAPIMESTHECSSLRAAKCLRTKLENALKVVGGKNVYKSSISDFWDK